MTTKNAAPPDVVARIRAAYDKMTNSQQRVAEFFLTHGVEAVYLPAARIAELVDVSHSTVVRTAQAIGYEGFPDLQAALQERFLGRISIADRYQFESKPLLKELADGEAANDVSSVLRRVMLTDAKDLETIVNRIPVPDFEQAVELLVTARRVYILGLRASSPLALNFGFGLRHIRSDCFILQAGNGDLIDQLEAMSKDDVLVTMCYSRYMRDTLRCMDYARELAAHIITLTDSTLSPAAKRANVAFVVPFRLWLYGPSAAPFSLLNALVFATLLRYQNSAQSRLEWLDKMYHQFSIFEPEE